MHGLRKFSKFNVRFHEGWSGIKLMVKSREKRMMRGLKVKALIRNPISL